MMIEMGLSCDYSISKPTNDQALKNAIVDLFCLLDRGDSYASEDKYNKLKMRILRGEYDDFEEKSYFENDDTPKPVENSYKDCLMKEHMIIKQTGIPRGALWISSCEYGHYQHGCHVFCLECLREGKRTRRIHGCNAKDCFGNGSFWKKHMNDDDSVIASAKCCHLRSYSDAYSYSLTPVGHLVLLTNAGLDDRITHSTRSELRSVAHQCKEGKVTCPSCSFNTAYCLSYLGEAEMAESICEIYKDLANPQSKRNTLKDIVEKMTGDSIEKRYYFKGMRFVSVDTCR